MKFAEKISTLLKGKKKVAGSITLPRNWGEKKYPTTNGIAVAQLGFAMDDVFQAYGCYESVGTLSVESHKDCIIVRHPVVLKDGSKRVLVQKVYEEAM